MELEIEMHVSNEAAQNPARAFQTQMFLQPGRAPAGARPGASVILTPNSVWRNVIGGNPEAAAWID